MFSINNEDPRSTAAVVPSVPQQRNRRAFRFASVSPANLKVVRCPNYRILQGDEGETQRKAGSRYR
jgi:hypothetical protein